MPYPKDKDALARWTAETARILAENPAPWNVYDIDFQKTAAVYNAFLQQTPGFRDLDWVLAKAISWVETGPGQPDWKHRVMQIGNQGDPGLHQLLYTPTGRMILPPAYKTLAASQVSVMPEMNIRAGIGYMLWVSARFGYQRVPVTGPAADTSAHPPKRVKTKSVLAIVGWRPINFELMATRYNAGDGNYLEKLKFVYPLARTGSVPPRENTP